MSVRGRIELKIIGIKSKIYRIAKGKEMSDEKRPNLLEQAVFWLKALWILGPAGAYRQYKAVKSANRPGVKVYVKSIRKD